MRIKHYYRGSVLYKRWLQEEFRRAFLAAKYNHTALEIKGELKNGKYEIELHFIR